jgi:uncharacterized protein YjbI with pentapeptide repeats
VQPLDQSGRTDAVADELAAGVDLELRRFHDLDLTGRDASSGRLLECSIIDCRLDGVVLDGTRVLDCELAGLGATTLSASRSTWRGVTIVNCRFGALDGASAALTDVEIRGGKIDFLNLRGASLARVSISDCWLGEMHLGGASVSELTLTDCRVDSLEMRGVVASQVDLRGADLRLVDGVEHLRGCRISAVQLQHLAPALAAHVGLLVGDPPVQRSKKRPPRS